MEHLIDSCVWIDFLRPATTPAIRQVADEAINRASAVVCEPVCFEMLRLCPKPQRAGVEKWLATLPLLSTPGSLWRAATLLGQRCKDAEVTAGMSDLLIASIALHHEATIVTFDRHFESLGKVSGLEWELLPRPG